MEFSKDDLLIMKLSCCFARDEIAVVVDEFIEDSGKHSVGIAESACSCLRKLDNIIEKLERLM